MFRHLPIPTRRPRFAPRIVNPQLYASLYPTALDSDHDGISDVDELLLGTNSFDADTDHDGYPDGVEIALGSNPLDANSTPDLNRPGFLISPNFSIFNSGFIAGLRRNR